MDSIVWASISGVGSAACDGLALELLYETIARIEHAALRPARTVGFDVCYEDRKTIWEVKLGIGEKLEVGICPEDNVDDLEISILVHPKLGFKKAVGRAVIATLQPDMVTYAGYTLLSYEKDYAKRGTYMAIGFIILATEEGEYPLPVEVCARDVNDYMTTLRIKVVK